MAVRLAWVVLLLAALAGVAWWLLGAPGRWEEAAARAGLKPPASVVYRWRDADGTVHVSDRPPAPGVPYERLEYRHDVNVLPAPPAE